MGLKVKVGFILLVALVIRIWGLDRLPIELFGDELDAGYQAYSILKTGKDYLGFTLPISFHSFSENRLPVFIYSLVPSVAIFGLNEWGVRVAPAVWGILSILFFFLVVYKLTDEKTALLASAFLAVTPWHWHYSRAGFEVTLLLLLVLMAVWFWFNQARGKWFLLASGLCMILALFTYSSAESFVPFLAWLLLWVFPPKGLTLRMKTVVSVFVLLGGLFLVLAGGQPGQRLGSVSLLSYKTLEDEIVFKRVFDASKVVGMIFHNKPVLIAREAVANYFKSFSPQFLALDGDPDPTHSEIGGGFGELFHVEYLLAILGIGVWVYRRRDKTAQFFLGWLVVAPLSSAVTIGGGEHATRLFLMVPGLVAASAVGFWALLGSLHGTWAKRLVKLVVGGGLAVETIFFVHHTVVHYRIESWRAWQYGYKLGVEALSRGKSGPMLISDKGEPVLIRYLFWSATDPGWFQRNFTGDQLRNNLLPGFDGFMVGQNVIFGNLRQGVEVAGFLKSGEKFMALQGLDVPGDYIFDQAKQLQLLEVVRDPLLARPLIQVVQKQ